MSQRVSHTYLTAQFELFSLKRLFEVLSREQFQVCPDDYVEALQVLTEAQPETLEEIASLLAPLIVTNGQEQDRFYQIFNQVAQNLVQIPTSKVPPPHLHSGKS